jgi:hypothetical protein
MPFDGKPQRWIGRRFYDHSPKCVHSPTNHHSGVGFTSYAGIKWLRHSGVRPHAVRIKHYNLELLQFNLSGHWTEIGRTTIPKS